MAVARHRLPERARRARADEVADAVGRQGPELTHRVSWQPSCPHSDPLAAGRTMTRDRRVTPGAGRRSPATRHTELGWAHERAGHLRREELQARHELHHDPHHGRRARRLPRRGGALPSRRRAGLPVGQPRDHRAPPARARGRPVDGDLRPDPRQAQLDLRPRPRRPRPGAADPAHPGRLLQARPRLPPRHHGSRDRRRADRRRGDQRLQADHRRPRDASGASSTARAPPTSTPTPSPTRSRR